MKTIKVFSYLYEVCYSFGPLSRVAAFHITVQHRISTRHTSTTTSAERHRLKVQVSTECFHMEMSHIPFVMQPKAEGNDSLALQLPLLS